MFSFSVSELPCGRRVWEFQSFSSQVRKRWPLSFQNYPSRQSQCTPVISGCVNPGQAMSPLCECTHYRGKGWSGSLNGCKCLAAKISKQKNLFLFKPWWTDICLPSVAACAKQQNCKVCVLKPQRNNWHAPTFLKKKKKSHKSETLNTERNVKCDKQAETGKFSWEGCAWNKAQGVKPLSTAAWALLSGDSRQRPPDVEAVPRLAGPSWRGQGGGWWF